jgi:hypothetical protein
MTQPVTDLDQLVEEWTLGGHEPLGHDMAYKEVLQQLEFLSKRAFSRFVPALFPPHNPAFLDRLLMWLHNVPDPNIQRILFQFAARLAYISFEDFILLYRAAYVGPVTRWIINLEGITLRDRSFQSRIDRERRSQTWYCPVTDSMVISEFYHANRITGIDQRPAFRPLRDFSDGARLRDYMAQLSLKRLVLMEDFMGTGAQASTVVEWAVETLRCPVLFIPMVACPAGVKRLKRLANKHRRLCVSPILVLDDSVFVSEGKSDDELLQRVAKLAQTVHHRVADNPDTTYGPFGFGDTGGTVVLFSNTPDNTLPLIHHHMKAPSKWRALFPRVSREI